MEISNIPTVMIRRDDGEVFSINSDGTYSSEYMKRKFPESSIMKYSLKTLGYLEFIPGFQPAYYYKDYEL